MRQGGGESISLAAPTSTLRHRWTGVPALPVSDPCPPLLAAVVTLTALPQFLSLVPACLRAFVAPPRDGAAVYRTGCNGCDGRRARVSGRCLRTSSTISQLLVRQGMSMGDADAQKPCLANGGGVRSSACVRCSKIWTRRSVKERRHLLRLVQRLVQHQVQGRQVGAAVGKEGPRKAGLSSCH